MRECICCQCSEDASEFKHHLHCEYCNLYGKPEDFDLDDQGMVCNNCMMLAEKHL